MKRSLAAIFMSFTSICLAQSAEEKAIIDEGYKLYRSEMASWYGSDIYLAEFKSKHDRTGGYLSYQHGRKAVCLFFSSDEVPLVLGTITFDSTYRPENALRDSTDRPMTEHESVLWKIRSIAYAEMVANTDKLFSFYPDTNPNIIPLSDELGKRVYILTGPKKSGVVIFGNDYKLTFDENNSLVDKARIHQSMIPTQYGPDKKGRIPVTAMHTHLKSTGDYFTPTDICTLLLYGRYTPWESYMVISGEKVSIWKLREKTDVTDKVQERLNNDKKRERKARNEE